MKSLLQDVRSGKFAEKWSLNPDRSKKELEDLIKKMHDHQIEKVGRDFRKMSGLE